MEELCLILLLGATSHDRTSALRHCSWSDPCHASGLVCGCLESVPSRWQRSRRLIITSELFRRTSIHLDPVLPGIWRLVGSMFTDQQAIGLQPTLFTEQREGLLVQPSVVGGSK